jgi:hypothetical protein
MEILILKISAMISKPGDCGMEQTRVYYILLNVILFDLSLWRPYMEGYESCIDIDKLKDISLLYYSCIKSKK